MLIDLFRMHFQLVSHLYIYIYIYIYNFFFFFFGRFQGLPSVYQL